MRRSATIGATLMTSLAMAAALALSGERLVGAWEPFLAIGLLMSVLHVARTVLTTGFRPAPLGHTEPVSVVVPVFREDPDVLAAALGSWLASGADEVLLVRGANEAGEIAALGERYGDDPRVRILETPDASKRPALATGIRAARNDIVVLNDSDTLWTRGTLAALVAPFADPVIGGVGTRPRVIEPEANLWRSAAAAMLDAKYRRAFPALAARGAVSLLSGRSAAYRREALLSALPGLLGETFGGRRCVSGDDGRLTWLVLAQGHRTTFQPGAVVWTMMPGTARGFARQRARHGRNDYRRYVAAWRCGWLRRQPAITRATIAEKLAEPASIALGVTMTALAIHAGDVVSILIWQAWLTAGRGVGLVAHLRRGPAAVLRLPLVLAVTVYGASAIKWWALLTLRRQAWGTRRADAPAPDGQAVTSLHGSLSAAVPAADRGVA